MTDHAIPPGYCIEDGNLVPTPEELQRQLAEIRAGWSETDRAQHLGLTMSEFKHPDRWTPPCVVVPPPSKKAPEE